MPNTFVKPFDYDVDLILNPHPLLRLYLRLSVVSEADPHFEIYPIEKNRIDARNELTLLNDRSLANEGYTLINLNKTVGGSFLNTLDVETSQLPGNYGIRLIEQLPTEI